MKCIVKVLSSALLAAGIIMPELNAAQIPIDMGINPSFETDAVLDGQRKNGNHTFPVPGGETTIAGGWHNYSPGGAGSGLGVGNPSAAEFATAGGDAGPLPSTADGAQALYLVGSNSFAYRISSTTIQPGNDYTAIVAFGAPLIDSPSGIVEMYLSMGPSGFFAAITPRLRFNANEIPLGTFIDKQLTYTSAIGDPNAGQQISVVVGRPFDQPQTGTMYVDNVRSIPEPGTVVLTMFSLACGCFARRNRR